MLKLYLQFIRVQIIIRRMPQKPPHAQNQLQEPQLTSPQALRPYDIILHRHTCHQFPGEVVRKLTDVVVHLSSAKALAVARKAWTKDQAVVMTLPWELAEHYRERLRDQGLAITIEPH